MSQPVLGRCANHRKDFAGWQCPTCKKLLCGKCTAEDREMFFCVECEGRAVQFVRPRSERTFFQLLYRAARYPFTEGVGWTALVAVSLTVISATAQWVERSPGVRSMFALPQNENDKRADMATRADAVAKDSESATATDPSGTAEEPEKPVELKPKEPPLPPVSERYFKVVRSVDMALRTLILFFFAFFVASALAWGHWSQRTPARRALQTLGATMLLWAPAIGYLVFVHRGPPDPSIWNDELALSFVALGFVYVPACLAATAGEIGRSVFNPFAVFRYLWQLGLRYLVTLLVVGVLAAVGAALTAYTSGSSFLVSILAQAALSGTVGIMAGLVGLLSHVYGYLIDWEPKERFTDPILEGVRATGILKRWTEQRAAIDEAIRASAEKRKTGDVGGQSVKLLARKIEESVSSGAASLALRTYEQQAEWPEGSLKDETKIELAIAANKAKKVDLARQLLTPVAAKQGRGVAKARLLLAQILSGIPEESSKAADLYRSVVTDFPKSEFARQAELGLTKMQGGPPAPTA